MRFIGSFVEFDGICASLRGKGAKRLNSHLRIGVFCGTLGIPLP